MKIFYAILKIELILYIRSLWIWLITLLLSIYLYIGYKGFLDADLEVGQLLQSSGYIVMSAILFGLIFGLYSARRENKIHFSEILNSMPGINIRHIAKLMAWLLISIFITLISIIEILLLIWLTDSQYIYFWDIVVQYIVVYWGITLLSSGIIGYALETFFPLKWWNLIIVLFLWLLFTPYNYIFDMIFPISILSILNQGERLIDGTYNGFFGLNISNSVIMKHLLLFVFSALLISFVLLIKNQRIRTTKEKYIPGLFVIIFSLILIPVYYLSVSPLDFNRFTSDFTRYYLNKDIEYYSQGEIIDQEEHNNYQFYEFNVSEYNIDLHHKKNEIIYTADLIIDLSDTQGEWLVFTLFHDLDVVAVEQNNNNLEWKRDNDVIMIKWPNTLNRGTLRIKVNGNTGAFNPITENSFFLSSSFPWYPIPGKHKVAEMSDLYYEPQYKNLQIENPSKFYITIHEKNKVYSNLQEIDTNVFYGDAKGATLLSGNLISKKVGTKTIVAPPDRIENIEEILPEIESSISKISEILEIPNREVPNNIYVIPSFSYLPHNYLFYTGDELMVNEYKTRSLDDIKSIASLDSVFQAFYWADRYRENDSYNSEIIRNLLEHTDRPSEYTSLAIVAKDAEILGSEATPIQNFSKKLLDLYNYDYQDELNLLLKKAYKLLETEEMEREDWERLLELELEKGDNND